MNFLQIALTTECNRGCWHCPMKNYLHKKQKFPMNNSELIPFLQKYIEPSNWVIELTGGEPSLYPEIEDLVDFLSERGYYTIIKTNGIKEIKPHKNVIRVAAFHDYDNPPKYYDQYLIIDKIDRERKEEYCKAHGIPYKVIGYNKENFDHATHGFQSIAFINPAGHQINCPADTPLTRERDGIDYNRITHKPLTKQACCKECKAAIDAWRYYG